MMEGCRSEPLEAAFRATVYRIEAGSICFELRIGQVNPSYDEFLANQGVSQWAVITACNPGARKRSAKENAEAQKALVGKLDGLGWLHLPARNLADDALWPVEESVLVLGVSRHEARLMAIEFGQVACVTGVTGRVSELLWVSEQRD